MLKILPDGMLDDPNIVWTDALLRFADVDLYGHVSNRAFSEIFEDGRIAFIRQHMEPRIAENLFVVIARLGIDFWNEFSFPGGARTGTWLSKLGRTSVTLDQVMLADSGVIGTATSVCVLVEKVSRQAAPFPAELRQALVALRTPDYAEQISTAIGRSKSERKAETLVT